MHENNGGIISDEFVSTPQGFVFLRLLTGSVHWRFIFQILLTLRNMVTLLTHVFVFKRVCNGAANSRQRTVFWSLIQRSIVLWWWCIILTTTQKWCMMWYLTINLGKIMLKYVNYYIYITYLSWTYCWFGYSPFHFISPTLYFHIMVLTHLFNNSQGVLVRRAHLERLQIHVHL